METYGRLIAEAASLKVILPSYFMLNATLGLRYFIS